MCNTRPFEAWRGVFHIGILCFILAFASIFPEYISKPAAAITISLFIIFEVLRLYNKRFASYVHDKFKWGFREREKTKRGSLIDGAIGVTIVFFLFPFEIFRISLLLSAFPDPIARFFGKGWGKRKIPYTTGKTYVGSVAFFVCAVLIVVFFQPIYIALIVGALATVMEAFAQRSYHLDDNFTVPISTAVALMLLVK